jgi:hypothetical protein
MVQPKFALIAGPWARTSSSSMPGGLSQQRRPRHDHAVDPRTGEAVDPVPGLSPRAGWSWARAPEWVPGLQSSLALWKLDFDSELVYVGDAGATEANRPAGGAASSGTTAMCRCWLLVDADLAWTHARFADADPAGSRIPNAVDGSHRWPSRPRAGPWSASLQWRYLGPGALIEDNSQRSRSSLTTNLRLSRALPGWGGAASWCWMCSI